MPRKPTYKFLEVIKFKDKSNVVTRRRMRNKYGKATYQTRMRFTDVKRQMNIRRTGSIFDFLNENRK